MPSLSERLGALAEMSVAQLKSEWGRVLREPAPPLTFDLLMRGIAYRLQERVHGGLTSDAKRKLRCLAKQVSANGEVALDRDVILKPGTRLSRDWRGKTHHVMVHDDGFSFEDRHYTSLTRIAFDITGTNWSGPRFFGLKRRQKPFAEKRGG